MKDGEVAGADGDGILHPQLAAIHRVEHRHRHPELRHALLRHQSAAIIGDFPIGIDAAHRNARHAIEAAAEGIDRDHEIGGRGKLLLDGSLHSRACGHRRHSGARRNGALHLTGMDRSVRDAACQQDGHDQPSRPAHHLARARRGFALDDNPTRPVIFHITHYPDVQQPLISTSAPQLPSRGG